MGDSHHPLGAHLGRFLFYRNRGGEYSQLAKGWVTPIAAATGVARYIGADGWLAIGVGLAIPVVIESCAFLAGWFDIRVGGARRQTALNNAQDPWKVRVIEILEKLEGRL